MRILIDECLDQRLRKYFPQHDCQTVRYAGFSGLKNGQLLDAAEADRFEVLVTADQGFEYEQNLTGRQIAIVILQAQSLALKDLIPLIPSCLALLATIKPGDIARIPRKSASRGP
jgi:predicted nuclease of predicted toxin-antitoxin system